MKSFLEKKKEVRIKPQYVIIRFKESGRAFKIREFQPVLLFFGTLKNYNQLHIHLRFNGRDEETGEKETIDLDLYIPKSECWKIKNLLS